MLWATEVDGRVLNVTGCAFGAADHPANNTRSRRYLAPDQHATGHGSFSTGTSHTSSRRSSPERRGSRATGTTHAPEPGLDRWVLAGGEYRPTLRNMREDEHGEKRFGATAQAAEWDERYSEREGAMWSGRPNGRLLAEVADLAPGRALDVGCGEGADAIWLARSGWTVTAIDISDVALSRARGRPQNWPAPRSSGSAGTPFSHRSRPGSFDLVSMQYPALPKAAGEAAVRSIARHGVPRRACCSPSTTTLTTSTAST